MATDFTAEIADVLSRVIDVDAKDVTSGATLRDLGVDSLAFVELVDELGRRTGGYLPDHALGDVRTVGELAAVAEAHVGRPAPVWVQQSRLVRTEWNPRTSTARVVKLDGTGRTPTSRTAVKKLALAMVLIGGVFGVVFGMTGSALTSALGLEEFRMPPLATASAKPQAPPAAEPSASPKSGDNPTIDRNAGSLLTSSSNVALGERFELSGAFPSLSAGAVLQVQSRTATTDWEDFPVTPTTRDGGTFKSDIWMKTPGTYKFRLIHKQSGAATAEVIVTIG